MCIITHFIRAHKLIPCFLFSWLTLFVLWLMPNRSEGPFDFVFMSIMFVIIVGSQLFWMSPGAVLRIWPLAPSLNNNLVLPGKG